VGDLPNGSSRHEVEVFAAAAKEGRTNPLSELELHKEKD
jgi:hypothetical protein